MLFEFPTKEDWKRLMATFPFERWAIPKFSLQIYEGQLDWLDLIEASLSLPTWERHLANRLSDTRQSYGMLMFYYELGIPDDEWMASPGTSFSSIQYFPHFEQRHFAIKHQFDYYTDIFYYKAFSAWDTIGQLLNEMYQLELKIGQVSFIKSIEKLQAVNNDLYNDLIGIWNSVSFEQAKEFRHSIAHRHPVNKQGPSHIRPSKNELTFGGCAYVPSGQLVANIRQVLELLAITLERIKDRCNAFRETDGFTIEL